MKRDVCKMCLLEKDLVSSHLTPAGLYHYLRAGEYRPVRVGDGVVFPTDRQTQDYLLCKPCEDILNEGGEVWVLPKLATFERSFPLHDLLTKRQPDLRDDATEVYFGANNPEIDVDKVVHFAMGLFWKASAHSWSGTDKEPRIELGSYSDAIRRWLLGEGPWPENVALTMIVSPPLRAQITNVEAYRGRQEEAHIYFIHIPGILFALNVGKRISNEMKELCLHRNPAHPIVVSEEHTNDIGRLFAQKFNESRKTAAYLKAKKKRDLELQKTRK